MDLIDIRNRFLQVVADHPIFPYPGAPPGYEDRPSASSLGPDVCMRQVVFNLRSRMDPEGFDFERLPEVGEGVLPAQRGWILEDSTRSWLNAAGVLNEEWEGPVFGPDDSFYGHPDGLVYFDGELRTAPGELRTAPGELRTALLEIKHQRLMSYMGFIKKGVKGENPVYYSQAQAYMAATGIDQTLFVILPFDLSAVKGSITMGKRGKNYTGELEPDFRMVAESSGVHPAVYFEMVPANKVYQQHLVSWAKAATDFARAEAYPVRGFDMGHNWHCDYCPWRPACEIVGKCGDICGHKGCAEPEPAEYRPRG